MGADARNGLPAWDPAAKAARVVHDPVELERDFAAGKLSLVADHEYPMVGSDGKVWSVPASRVQENLKAGFHLASGMDVARAEARSTSGAVRAAADGALDAATLGFGDAMQAKLGADPLALRARAEEHGGARAAGFLGGAGLAALLTDGASLGGLAEAGAARAIGTEAAATVLGRTAVTAAGGAAEGAVVGVGHEVSEAVLGDAPLAAESLIAAGGHGAFWGGAAGALLGRALGRRAPKPTAEEINAAAAKALGEAPPKGYGQQVLDVLDSHAASQLEAQGAGDLAQALRGSPEARKRFLELAQTPKAELEDKARQLAAGLEERVAAHEGVQRSVKLEQRVQDAAQARAEAAAAVTRAKADDSALFADAEQSLKTLQSRADAASERYSAADAELRRLRLEDSDRMLPAQERAREQLSLEVTDARRAVSEAQAALKAARSAGPLERLQLAKEAADAAYAEARAAHGAWTRDNAAVERLRSDFGIGADGKVAAGKVESFVNAITRPRADARVDALKQLAGDDAKLSGLIDDIGEIQGARNLLRDQLEREQASGMDAELLAGVVGHGVAGFPGALAARSAAAGFTRPAHSLLARYQLASTVQRVHGYVRDRLSNFASGARESLEEAQAVGRRYGFDRRLASATSAMLSAPSASERRDAAASRIAELEATDPTMLADRLAETAPDVDAHAPGVSGVLRQRLADAHALLRSVIPVPLGPAGDGGGLVPRRSSRMLSDRDVARFAAVDAAIQDPLRLMDQLAAGRVPDPAAVLAVQTAFPALWGHMTQELTEQLTTHADKVGWRQAMAISVTMGIAGHPSVEPAALNLQQALARPQTAAQAQHAARPGPVTRALGRAQDRALSGATATVNDRLMERGSGRRL
jgi:hypothetical protein